MEVSRGEAWNELQWRGWIAPTCLTEAEDPHTVVLYARNATLPLGFGSPRSPQHPALPYTEQS